MDLKFLLNPLPEPDPLPRININTTTTSGETTLPHVSTGYLQSRFFLSPRRLDPETSSVSTNSSTKRRRTEKERVDADASPAGIIAAEKMSRTFSELQVPSDESTDEDTVKRGVESLSLTGTW
jgi:hypothetical protein